MKLGNRVLAALLAGCMVFGLAACGANTTQETPEAEAAEGTRTIVDQMGNTVELPAEINRVVIASVWPLCSVYCLAEGSTEKLVGLDPAIISAAENSLLIKVFPELSDLPSGFSKNGELNAEELLKLEPDVVLYASGIPEDYDVCQQAGIPAVGFSLSVKDFNAVDTINSWIELLGEVMGKDYTNNEFVQYGVEMQEMVASRLEGLSEEDKPKCMVIHTYDGATFNCPGTKAWGDYWITASGGINVAAAAGDGTNGINMEQIYEWNPDRIFMTNFNDLIPEDLYNNAVADTDWSSVNAVKNQEVYKNPLGMYRWYVTCSDSSLMLLWMAKTNHPDLFEDIDMNQTIRDFYKKFYDIDFTEEEIETIFVPKREASAGI